jgi:hypothetical protein
MKYKNSEVNVIEILTASNYFNSNDGIMIIAESRN